MWFSKSQKYTALEDQEAKLLHQDNSSLESIPRQNERKNQDDFLPRRYWRYIIYVSIIDIILLATSSTLFLSWFTNTPHGRNALLKATSFYSPILDKLNIPTSVKMMNATLYPGPTPSYARQHPNPEADAWWDELELLRTIPITRKEVLKLGKDPEIVAKFEDAYWGLGDDAYMAQVDVFHQMHCLNQLRKLIYPTYYNYSANTVHHADLWFVHLNHCVDVLAQNLMCTGNTDLYTLNWMETQGYPFPDFNINHQCRDFDALVEWRKREGVDIEKWVKMKKPEGVKQVEPSEGIKELLRHEHEMKGHGNA
ncbi:hypothetical protein EG329_012404 [Mollisiaceae sp. DMI_Dod_QoI]|nr:hypothetical protein EG329_012404 [Helotiales sp. DMI_Dod_QoI]